YFLFIQLSRRIAWQYTDKLDLTWCFIVRQPFTAISEESLRVDGSTSNDEGFHFFTHTLRWYADHRHLAHCWMPAEYFFYIARIDIEPPADDQVLLTFDNIQVTIFVKASHVACMQPAILQRRLCLVGHIVITSRDIGATSNHLTYFANRYWLVVFIHYEHFYVW